MAKHTFLMCTRCARPRGKRSAVARQSGASAVQQQHDQSYVHCSWQKARSPMFADCTRPRCKRLTIARNSAASAIQQPHGQSSVCCTCKTLCLWCSRAAQGLVASALRLQDAPLRALFSSKMINLVRTAYGQNYVSGVHEMHKTPRQAFCGCTTIRRERCSAAT